MDKPQILIISPALAKANNGNWRTAERWAGFLQERYEVAIADGWTERGAEASNPPAALIALHARRSAAVIAAFSASHPERPLILTLTGTDLYRDIRADVEAQRSLRLATRLVVLQEAGVAVLPRELRPKAVVIHQSAPALEPAPARAADTDREIVMVGHLRDEKDPVTFMRAAALVKSPRARFLHVGAALDPALGDAAAKTQENCPAYQWLGELPHAEAREIVRRGHAMVIASRMEGGAHVVIEAVTSGVPVLASDISGNRGMLGEDYAGYFRAGDQRALAKLIDRSIADPEFHGLLRRQCAARAALFTPEREKAALLGLMDNVLNSNGTST